MTGISALEVATPTASGLGTKTASTKMNKGTLIKRSMRINGHRTSVALEQEFWAVVDRLAKQRGWSVPRLITDIDAVRPKDDDGPSLASAVRVYVLTHNEGPSDEA